MRIAAMLVAALGAAVPASAQTVYVIRHAAAEADVIREVHRIAIAGHSAMVSRDDARQSRTFKVEQTHRETRTLAVGASGTLDLETYLGDITVTAGSGRDATLEIIRRARGKTDADVKLGLDQVKVTVDLRPDRARVRAVYPDGKTETYSVDVSYVISAPAGTHVASQTISGNITIKGIRGDVSADVTSGHIDLAGSRVSVAKTISGPITLTDVETDGTLDIRTVSGAIILQNVKARRVAADAVASGDVTARNLTCDAATLKTLSGIVEYAGTLSKNGRYELSAFSGDVRFAPVGPVGFELQVSTFSGEIRPDKSMTFRDVSLGRRSLRGTFGDGGAIVTLKTFSGDVTVGK